MYSEYEGRRGIHGVLLWCYRAPDVTTDAADPHTIPKSGQRKRSNMHRREDNPPTKCAKKLKQIEEICR